VSETPGTVVIVGGGLAGLAAAEEALSAEPARRIVVLEPTGRCGGVIGTVREDGWLVERSADCFLAARPEGVELVERLGLTDRLIGVDSRVRRALVWHRGRAEAVPPGFRLLAPGRLGSILTTQLLSPLGRLRVVAERWVPRRDAGEESLQAFATRRLGREAFDRLVQPLAAGIWTADPARLGMAAACGEFVAMERQHGSLWAGEQARLRTQPPAAEAAGARYGQFVSFADGMETLPATLAERLRRRGVEFRPARVDRLARRAEGWMVTATASGGEPVDESAAAVVLALPAPAAGRLVADFDPGLAADLTGIEYAGSVIVSLGFARNDVAHPLDAAGLVVPRVAGRRALAVSFSSSKFPGRAPAGHVLMRVFLGGALDPTAVELDDHAIIDLAIAEARALVGAAGIPRYQRLDRWASSMPQYHVGHADRVARIERAVLSHPGLALAGAAYRGVGIPQVIASGQAAARQALAVAPWR
jgi:oxygen-dependent protoporphyrinogen oxidase